MHGTAGLGMRGLLGMKRVGVEVAGAGTDREMAYLALRWLALELKRVAARNGFEITGGC